MSTPNAARSPAATTGFAERIALPAGARVVSVTAAGDRFVVHVETPGGPASAYIVDPRNGALVGTVEVARRDRQMVEHHERLMGTAGWVAVDCDPARGPDKKTRLADMR